MAADYKEKLDALQDLFRDVTDKQDELTTAIDAVEDGIEDLAWDITQDDNDALIVLKEENEKLKQLNQSLVIKLEEALKLAKPEACCSLNHTAPMIWNSACGRIIWTDDISRLKYCPGCSKKITLEI